MPLKHVYFAVGAAHGAALAVYVYAQRRAWYSRYRWMRRMYHRWPHWPVFLPLLLAGVGVWGLVPDGLYALGVLPKEVVRGPLFDVFFFYSTLERWEDLYPSRDWLINSLGSLALFGLALGVLGFYAHLIRKALRAQAGGQP